MWRRPNHGDEDEFLLVPLQGQLSGTLSQVFLDIQRHAMMDNCVPLHKSVPVQAQVSISLCYKGASESACTNMTCHDNTHCHQPSNISGKRSTFFGWAALSTCLDICFILSPVYWFLRPSQFFPEEFQYPPPYSAQQQ
jgi:hypothetical protein